VHEIEVWHVNLDAPAPGGVLTADEHARAARIAHGEHARRWAASRAALRVLLGARLDVAPREVSFAHGPHGKPEVGGELAFNLSHAGAVALVALSHGRELGIDVERTDRRSHAIARALTGNEREALGDAPGHFELLRVWCRKEALAKATGGGLRWAPERFDTTAPGPYALTDLDAGTGYVAALAVEGDEPYSISPRRMPSASAADGRERAHGRPPFAPDALSRRSRT
jgi:4'-phosphopantetheinyl transferase